VRPTHPSSSPPHISSSFPANPASSSPSNSLFGYHGSVPFPHTKSPFPAVSKRKEHSFTVETVAPRNRTIVTKQPLTSPHLSHYSPVLRLTALTSASFTAQSYSKIHPLHVSNWLTNSQRCQWNFSTALWSISRSLSHPSSAHPSSPKTGFTNICSANYTRTPNYPLPTPQTCTL